MGKVLLLFLGFLCQWDAKLKKTNLTNLVKKHKNWLSLIFYSAKPTKTIGSFQRHKEPVTIKHYRFIMYKLIGMLAVCLFKLLSLPSEKTLAN